MRFLTTLVALVLVSLTLTAPLAQAGDLDWLEGLTLIALEETGPQAVHRAVDQIQAAGGVAGVMTTDGIVLGWLPEASDDEVVGKAGIRSVHRAPVTLPELGMALPKAGGDAGWYVEYFNRAKRGELSFEQDERENESNLKWDAPIVGGDVKAPEVLDEQVYYENLERAGFPRDLLDNLGLNDPAKGVNNDVMGGTAWATLFIIESDGSGAYPNDHDWSEQDVQDIVDGRITGLLWWTSTAPSYGCWIAFLMEVYEPDHPACQNPREPVNTGQVSAIMQDTMNFLGYGGSAYSANTSFNTANRLANGTDRAFSMITTWPDGRAWAYRYGPYTWLPGPPPAPPTTAHEIGHIFGACDEYLEACASCGGGVCANGVTNPNCEACAGSVACIMKANTYTLCAYTDDHVGWSLGACSPPGLPSPDITDISPSSGEAGETVTVTITGTNLLQAAQLDLGPGIHVYETSYNNGTTIVAEVAIDTQAAPGMRDADIVNPDLGSDTLANGFEVLGTPFHYYSPSGGNVFPYTSAASAATVLQDALDAAGPGDIVHLEEGTLPNLNKTLSLAVTISGGWDPSFSSQDLVDKTVMELAPNLKVLEDVTFDNIRFLNGDGRTEVLPVAGKYGGAIEAIDANLTVTNCDFVDNVAQDLQDVGLGGAIYLRNGSVDIRDSSFSSNDAYTGGAIYLENATGILQGNTFSNNLVATGGSETPTGAAVYLTGSTGVVLEDNVFDTNTGANAGGGLYVVGGSGTVVRGGSFQGQSVGFQGGGVAVDGTDLLVEDVTFDGNSAASLGASIAMLNGASVTLRESRVLNNSTALGAGVYAPGGELHVEHTVFRGNTVTVTGGAVFASSLTDGAVLGNVAWNNSVPSSGADFLIAGSPIDIRNNIVVGSTGTGISCNGATADYNNVSGSTTADYDGCTPGPGTISGDPLFSDPANGDFHLTLHSPSLDAGDPDPSLDDPDGSRGDHGVYGSHTFVMDQPAAPSNLQASLAGSDAVLTWDANGEGDLANYAVYSDASSGFVPSLANFETLVPAGTTTVNLGPPGGTRYYRISAVDTDGYASGYSAESSVGGATANEPAPLRWMLHQNVPNPFNPQTTISYQLRDRTPVMLAVFDITGRRVATLVDRVEESGPHSVVWNATADDGSRVASGIYFYKIKAGDFTATNKMIVLK